MTMKTCEAGILIAEPGMKCDHEVEMTDWCADCEEDANELVVVAIEKMCNAAITAGMMPKEVRLSSDMFKRMMDEWKPRAASIQMPGTVQTYTQLASATCCVDILEDGSLPDGTIQVS